MSARCVYKKAAADPRSLGDLHPTGPALIADGYDAGVSMRSIHCPRTGETATVLGNTTEGARPVGQALLGLFG